MIEYKESCVVMCSAKLQSSILEWNNFSAPVYDSLSQIR